MSTKYLLGRILRGLLTVSLAVVIIFFLMRVAPSDPATMLAAEDATEEEIAEIREEWGLNKPYTEQFVLYLKSLLTGDAGMSYMYAVDQPIYTVTELVISRIPNTIKLAFASIIFSVLVSIPIGILMGLKPGSWFDNLMSAVCFTVNAFPTFFMGLLLILIFGVWLEWLPTGGNEGFSSIILPAITLSGQFCVTLTRMTRTQFIRVMSSNFIRTTKAKGLSNVSILFCHGLRNVSIPLVTLIGLRIGSMLGGSVIVETLFRWPGIGYLLITAVNCRDYPTVQFLVPYIALVFVVVNLLVDILYSVLDPRIKRNTKG